jgi:hypothetical protein
LISTIGNTYSISIGKTYLSVTSSVTKTISVVADCSQLEYMVPESPTSSFIVDETGTYSPNRDLINDDAGVSWTPTCGEATVTFTDLQSFMTDNGNNSLTIAPLYGSHIGDWDVTLTKSDPNGFVSDLVTVVTIPVSVDCLNYVFGDLNPDYSANGPLELNIN